LFYLLDIITIFVIMETSLEVFIDTALPTIWQGYAKKPMGSFGNEWVSRVWKE